MNVNFRRVMIFVEVARARSITAAARQLNMTPPAVSKSVRELEGALGTNLFVRTSRGMQLTPAGEIFVPHAERALTEISQGQEEISSLQNGSGGHVSVGVTPEAANLVLPNALVRLLNRRRGVGVATRGGTHEALARDVRSGTLDFFVGVIPQEGAPSGFSCEVLYEDELKIIVRAEHPLARLANVELSDLAPYRWVDATGQGALASLMRRSFEQIGIATAGVGVVIEQLGAMRAVIRQTDLFAVATRTRVHDELELGLFVTLPVVLPFTSRLIGTFVLQNSRLSVRAQELLSYLHDEGRRMT